MRSLTTIVLLWAVVAATSAGCRKDPQVAKREFLDRGNRYSAQQKYKEAVVEYRNALNIDPLYGEARRQLAEAYDKLGDAPNALREYVRAADVLPDVEDVQLKAGMLLLASGSFEDAGARANKVLAKDPKSVDALVLLGLASSGLRDADSALAKIEEAIKIDPKRTQTYFALAQVQLDRGDLNHAEQAFKSAVSVDPDSTEANLAISNFYLSTGRSKEAGAWLEKAAARRPNDAKINHALGIYYMAAGRMAEAEAPLKAAAQGPESGPRLLLADYYYSVGRTGEARTLVEQLKEDQAVFAEARTRLAILEYDENRHAQAYQLLDEVLKREPKNSTALLLRGRFLLTDNKPTEALPFLQTAATVAPKFVGSHYWLGTAYRLLNKNQEAAAEFLKALELRANDAPALAQLSMIWLGQGKVEDALNTAKAAVQHDPNYVQGHVALAKALLANGDGKAADGEAVILTNQFAGDLDAQIALGMIAMNRRQPGVALQSFQKAMKMDANSVDAISGIVAALVADRKAASARDFLEPQLAKRPTDPKLLLVSAEIYGAEADTAKQEEMLRRAIEADPLNLKAYVLLAHILMARGNMDESRRQYEVVIARDPKNVPIITLTALMLQVQDKKAEAIKRYERALQVDPHAGIAANNLAMIYSEDHGNLDHALNLAQVAVQTLPNAAESNDTLGWVYYLKGLPTSAVPPFLESVKRDPKNPIYHYHLGLAYEKLGDKPKARASLEQALKLKPNFDGADDARRLLAEK